MSGPLELAGLPELPLHRPRADLLQEGLLRVAPLLAAPLPVPDRQRRDQVPQVV